ncbi:MAG: hypothetical protein ACR2JI_14360 [Mycobacterium sp.]
MRQQVMDIVRRAGSGQELETPRATGAITDAEYGDKRTQILADL